MNVPIYFQNKRVEPLPSLLQVQNVVKRSRKSTSSRSFTLQELRSYCEENHDSPAADDADRAYVVRYSIDSNQRFCVVWSTQKLLAKHAESKLIQVGLNGISMLP